MQGAGIGWRNSHDRREQTPFAHGRTVRSITNTAHGSEIPRGPGCLCKPSDYSQGAENGPGVASYARQQERRPRVGARGDGRRSSGGSLSARHDRAVTLYMGVQSWLTPTMVEELRPRRTDTSKFVASCVDCGAHAHGWHRLLANERREPTAAELAELRRTPKFASGHVTAYVVDSSFGSQATFDQGGVKRQIWWRNDDTKDWAVKTEPPDPTKPPFDVSLGQPAGSPPDARQDRPYDGHLVRGFYRPLGESL